MVLKTAASVMAFLLLQLPTSTLGTKATNTNKEPRIVDLSQDIPQDEAAIATSPGAAAIQEAALQDPLVRAVIVLEDGDIVSSYYRDDVDPKRGFFNVHSVTKSWMSLLLGIMVKEGLLSLDETLSDIFPDDNAWADVIDGSIDFRKSVTVEEMLTMTSGLVDDAAIPMGGRKIDINQHIKQRKQFASAICYGGCDFEGSLSFPGIGVKGEFSYLNFSNIPSYIIQERTGMTPRQYLAEHVMGYLGIGEDEYDWPQNDDGVEIAFNEMLLTPMQMAKFGQLYLQGGRTNPSNGECVISQEWIDASFTEQTIGTVGGNRFPHGYLFYNAWGSAWCAIGAAGQAVCVDHDLGRVVIQQRDVDGSGFEKFLVPPTALDGSLSFRAGGGDSDGVLGSSPVSVEEY